MHVGMLRTVFSGSVLYSMRDATVRGVLMPGDGYARRL